MKTVNYFGVDVEVPDYTMALAMDGGWTKNRLVAYNTTKVGWNKGTRQWEYTLDKVEWTDIGLSKSQIKAIRLQTKPKNSLVLV